MRGAIEAARRLPRVDPAAPAVAGDAGQLVPERLVGSSKWRCRVLSTPASAAGLSRSGSVGFGLAGSLPRFDSDVARHLRAPDRRSAACRCRTAACPCSGKPVLMLGDDVAGEQPCSQRSSVRFGPTRPPRSGRWHDEQTFVWALEDRLALRQAGRRRSAPTAPPRLAAGPARPPAAARELGLILGNHAGLSEERLGKHVVVHEVTDGEERS